MILLDLPNQPQSTHFMCEHQAAVAARSDGDGMTNKVALHQRRRRQPEHLMEAASEVGGIREVGCLGCRSAFEAVLGGEPRRAVADEVEAGRLHCRISMRFTRRNPCVRSDECSLGTALR